MLAFLLSLAACVHRPARDQGTDGALLKPPTIATESDLAKVIAKLGQPQERMQAFADLLAFADPMGYVHTGDLDADALHAQAYDVVRDCPDREAIVTAYIDQLGRRDSRLRAMLVLMHFAGEELWSRGGMGYGGSGDEAFDGLRKRAAAAVHQCADLQTVAQALDSADRQLQYWAVAHFGGPEPIEQQPNPWVPLLPTLERVVVEAEAGIRSLANQRRRDYPEACEFLAERAELETSPEVLMRLMRDEVPLDEFNERFVARLRAVLSHPDPNVRHDALLFVGFGLSEQLDREDVQAVIAALLRDDDPGVRYMTILAVGPDKHVQELQELARCANRQIAGWAAEKLDQLAQSQASTNAPVTRSVP